MDVHPMDGKNMGGLKPALAIYSWDSGGYIMGYGMPSGSLGELVAV